MRTLISLTLLVSFLTGCGDKDYDTGTAAAECTTGEFQCTDAEVLQECIGSTWTDTEDCAALGLMCHAEMGHCMEMDGEM